MRRAAVLLLAAAPVFCGAKADQAPPPCKTPYRKIPTNGNIPHGKLIFRVEPVYPAIAKQFAITGVVNVNIIIAKDGSVERVSAIPPSHILLVPAVIEAVRQWRFEPTLMNCVPVEVEASVVFVYPPPNEVTSR